MEVAMIAVDNEQKEFRSPQAKLLRFFERSRNGWKRKCRKSKDDVKRLTNNVAALKRSRSRWKVLAKQRNEEIERLRRELDEAKKQLS
jgi:predicted RNase H-like nuclease (RuvC/YqgF family)